MLGSFLHSVGSPLDATHTSGPRVVTTEHAPRWDVMSAGTRPDPLVANAYNGVLNIWRLNFCFCFRIRSNWKSLGTLWLVARCGTRTERNSVAECTSAQAPQVQPSISVSNELHPALSKSKSPNSFANKANSWHLARRGIGLDLLHYVSAACPGLPRPGQGTPKFRSLVPPGPFTCRRLRGGLRGLRGRLAHWGTERPWSTTLQNRKNSAAQIVREIAPFGGLRR